MLLPMEIKIDWVEEGWPFIAIVFGVGVLYVAGGLLVRNTQLVVPSDRK